MKFNKLIIILFGVVFSPILSAAVYCTSVPVTAIEGADGAGFHKFDELGVSGEMLYLVVDSAYCSTNGTENDTLNSSIYLVLDGLGSDVSVLKKTWISLILTAQSTGKHISFNARYLGQNSVSRQVVSPYYLRMQ